MDKAYFELLLEAFNYALGRRFNLFILPALLDRLSPAHVDAVRQFAEELQAVIEQRGAAATAQEVQ